MFWGTCRSAIGHRAGAGGGLVRAESGVLGMILSPFRCACGSDDIVSVAPGNEEDSYELLGTRIVLRAGAPVKAWCEKCWPMKEKVA